MQLFGGARVTNQVIEDSSSNGVSDELLGLLEL